MYLEKKYTDSATLEHSENIKGVNLVESWITESRTKDKSAMYGLSVPVGTWMGTFKIDNEKIWQEFVKTGAVKGFSIEGIFSHDLVEASMQTTDLMIKDISELSEEECLAVLKHIIRTLEGQPSITSSYPGEAATGSIAPETLPLKTI
jgi:hypothetical protein